MSLSSVVSAGRSLPAGGVNSSATTSRQNSTAWDEGTVACTRKMKARLTKVIGPSIYERSVERHRVRDALALLDDLHARERMAYESLQGVFSDDAHTS